MGAGSRRIVVEFLGKDTSLSRTANQAEGTTSRLGSRMKKVGLIAGAGLASGAVIAGKALFNMGKAAAEDAQSQEMLARALKANAKATKAEIAGTEKWISAKGRALGVADDKLRPALSNLVRVTGDVSKSQKLAELAMNISAGTGKDLETVSLALAKGYRGNVGALGKLGVATKDADGKTKSFAKIQDSLAQKFRGSASTAANTFQGKMARLKLQLDEAKESIGAKLLPVAEKLANWFVKDGLPAIQKFGAWFQKNIIPALRDAGEKIAPKLKSAMEGIKKAFQDAQPFIELVGKVLTNVLIPGMTKVASVVLPIWVKSLQAVAKGLGAVAETGRWMWNTILAPTFRLITGAMAGVLDTFAKMLRALGKVPGMGWAKKAANNLETAATKARQLRDGLADIPNNKHITVKFRALFDQRMNALIKASGGFLGPVLTLGVKTEQRAAGGRVRAGQTYQWNEHGMELFKPDVSGTVIPAEQSARIMSRATSGGSGGTVRHIVELRLNGKIIREILLDDKSLTGMSLGLT